MYQQDFIIHEYGSQFHVQGQIDSTVIKSDKDAATVLQFAVDALAGEGGEVRLQRGLYPLTTPLRLASKVILRGSGRGTKLVAPEGGIAVLGEGLKGAVLSDLAVVGPGTAGIVLDDCGDCQVRDVFVQGFDDYGIWVRNNSFLCEVNGCKLAGNSKANIYMDNLFAGGRGGDFVPNLITNCIIYGGGTGIECKRTIVLNIVGCVVHQPGKYAYHLHDTSNSVLLSGCRSFQVEEHAVVVESTHELNITGNIFCWHRGHGLVLRDVSWAAITGNEFIDQGVRTRDGAFTNGIVIAEGTQGAQVTGNTVFNWGDQCPMQVGIQEDASCRNNLIANNNINFYTEAAVMAEGQGTLVKDNVGEKDRAYQGMGRPPYPDFTTERLAAFMEE